MKARLEVQPLPLLLREGKRQVRVILHVREHLDNPRLSIRSADEQEVLRWDRLAPGRHVYTIGVDEPAQEIRLYAELTADEIRVGGAEFALAPVKPWSVRLMHQSHYDIGYTDLQKEIYKLQNRNIDQVLDYADMTESWQEDDKFRWTVECTFPLLNYLANRPESVKKRFIEAVRKGHIEVAASLFTLHAEFCSQEELIRSFYPVAELRKLGIPIRTAIQTDVPGTPSIMPRLLNNIGIRQLAMSPNNHLAPFHRLSDGKLPRPFYWSSGYGDEVLTLFTDLHDQVYQEGNILGFLQSVEVAEERLPDRLLQLENQAYPYDIVGLRTQGTYSDNGPPNLVIAQVVRAWNEKYAYPKIRNATFGETLQAFGDLYGRTIPSVTGDWPDWWAEGVGSAARELAMIRKAQDQTQFAQTVYALTTAGTGERYPRERLDAAWGQLLLSDEHTWGAAKPENNEARKFGSGELQWGMKKSYMYNAALEADRLEEGAIAFASVDRSDVRVAAPHIKVMNGLSWDRADIVRVPVADIRQALPGAEHWRLFEAEGGREVVFQIVPEENGVPEQLAFVAYDVPAFGSRTYTLSRDDDAGTCVPPAHTQETRRIWDPVMSNGYYRIETCPITGGLARLTDLDTGRELAKPDGPYRFNQTIHQSIRSGHFWLIDRKIEGERVDDNAVVDRLEQGPVFDRLIVNASCGGIPVRKTVTLYHGVKKLDLTLRFVKPHSLEKEAMFLALPLGVDEGQLRIETLGDAIRPGFDQIPGSSVDWYVARKYVDVSNEDWGVTVTLPDSPLIQAGNIRTPSVRGSYDDRGEFYVYLLNNLWPTNFPPSQGGELVFEFGISPHEGPFDPIRAERVSAQSASPLRAAVRGGASSEESLRDVRSRIRVGGDGGAVVVGVSRSDDGAVVLRLTEIAGAGVEGVRLDFPLWTIERAVETNAIEEEIGEIAFESGAIALSFRPKEIKTVKLFVKLLS